jgi:hypothetical protein
MSTPLIESYRFGQIVIDGQKHNKDVIILPDRVVTNWWRGSGHRLARADLEAVFDAAPEVLVVGQGANSQMKIPKETIQALENAGIELIALSTGEAWKKYNQLRTTGSVAAALHLTC